MDHITVYDFGGQYAHLIASRIRRLGVHAVVDLPEHFDPKKIDKNCRGIVLSGSPRSVSEKGAPTIDSKVFESKLPVLGMCYGHQLTAHLLGGKVAKGKQAGEYGPAKFGFKSQPGIFAKLKKNSTVWMSHGDEVAKIPAGFELVGSTPGCQIAALANSDKKIFTVQFHPEVVHTEIGGDLIANFVALTGAKKEWNTTKFLADEIKNLKKQVGDRKVFMLVSGGVDSSVAFALLEKALGKKRVFGMLVDHGLMRANEADLVTAALAKAGFPNLHVADESGHFLAALKKATEPEDKRRIIGRVFLAVQRKALKRLGFNPRQWLLGQGTIYPDTIESGGTKHADKIKTHHNRVPEIEAMIKKGLVVEPLRELYKDEVREVGRKLGLPAALIDRHPFPGPGLGVRLLCGLESEKPATTGRIEQEIKRKWKLSGKVMPIRSVGVQGDARTYAHAVALFTSGRDIPKLAAIAAEICQKWKEINRVVLCLNTTTAPRSLRFRPATLTRDRIQLLQAADQAAMDCLAQAKEKDAVWQMPVVLAPVSSDAAHESVILRPIQSQDAMTAQPSALSPALLKSIASSVAKAAGEPVEYIFYDLTSKPPGTIEWE